MAPKRNAKCPCGSGHKYKKCCGKERSNEQSRLLELLKKQFSVGRYSEEVQDGQVDQEADRPLQ